VFQNEVNFSFTYASRVLRHFMEVALYVIVGGLGTHMEPEAYFKYSYFDRSLTDSSACLLFSVRTNENCVVARVPSAWQACAPARSRDLLACAPGLEDRYVLCRASAYSRTVLVSLTVFLQQNWTPDICIRNQVLFSLLLRSSNIWTSFCYAF